MTGLALALVLLGVFAAGCLFGLALASWVYSARYRALRVEIDRGGRMRTGAEVFRP